MWIRPRSLLLLAAGSIPLGLSGRAAAQQEAAPSPEKVEERRIAAEKAPLFAGTEPLAHDPAHRHQVAPGQASGRGGGGRAP